MNKANVQWFNMNYEPIGAEEKPERFGFSCPRSGNLCEGLLIRGEHGVRPSWMWNGNREQPTFMPSINCGVCGWHGYIIQGHLET